MEDLTQNLSEAGTDISSTLRGLTESLVVQGEGSQQLMKYVFIALLVLGIILFVVIVVLALQAILNYRSQKMQREQFTQTIQMVKDMQEHMSYSKDSALPPGHNSLALPGTTSISQEDMQRLALECEDLGELIDKHTDRRNNSKSVSELVFKVCTALGLDRETSMLYFCAAMVYDAGFLSIPADVFRVEILSAEERAKLKEHVSNAEEYLDFVPKECMPLFLDAATKHHENMNGTGYPSGLKGEAIPHVARVIHCAESYVSLTSRRLYHRIRDKDSAVAELKRQPGIYDGEVIDALEHVV
mgnify:CR=1 FL=1